MSTQALSSLWTDGTSTNLEVSGNQLREKFWHDPVIRLGGAVRSISAHRAEDPGLNVGPDENFPLKINNVGATRLLV